MPDRFRGGRCPAPASAEVRFPVLLALALLVGPAAASPLAAQTVRGHLRQAGTDEPVTLGHVALLDTGMTVVANSLSDHEGFFELVAPAPGDYYVVADRLGYDPVLDGIIELGEGGVLPVEIHMTIRVIEIEGLSVTARRQRVDAQLENAGFWDRMEAGQGKFITPDDIARRPSMDIPQLMREIPQVQFLGGKIPIFRARAGRGIAGGAGLPPGYCMPRVYVDGAQVDLSPMGGEPLPIEYAVGLQDIVGVEVYSGGATVPLQWGGSQGSCGVIIFWTDGGG